MTFALDTKEVDDSRVHLIVLERLSRDLAEAAKTLSAAEARFLIDSYYTMQQNRIRIGEQIRALCETTEPHEVLQWLGTQSKMLEIQIKRALNRWTDAHEIGRWLKSIPGIGPVIAAGLIAHIDINKAPTAGHIWSFAGLDPTTVWNRGKKRPFNASLKVLCWKAGESFVKVSNRPDDVYGKFYQQRKVLERVRNEQGLFAEQAMRAIKKKIGKDTEAYKCYSAGRLPEAHIHARACRYAVKIFLAHFQEVYWWLRTGQVPPAPYSIAILGHVGRIDPPNTHLLNGWPELKPRPKAEQYVRQNYSASVVRSTGRELDSNTP